MPAVFAISFGFRWMQDQAERASLSPAGGPDPVLNNMFLSSLIDMALGLGSLVAFITGFVLVCIRRTRFSGVFVMLCALGYFGGWAIEHIAFGDPRTEAWTKTGERMMPLVKAIETYHHDQGKYPERLDALVPTYLDKLPSTGM